MSYCLGQDNVEEGFCFGKAHGNAGFDLAFVDTFDTRSKHFGDVSRKIHAEGNHCNEDGVDVYGSKNNIEYEHQ